MQYAIYQSIGISTYLNHTRECPETVTLHLQLLVIVTQINLDYSAARFLYESSNVAEKKKSC